MKNIILFILLFCCLHSQATNYYWSAISGDDNTGNGTFASPWQTLSKLQSKIPDFVNGDSALMKAGEVYFGKIDLGQNFQSASFIITRYGAGADPVFSCLATVGFWSSVGTNIYEATVPGIGTSKVQLVRINGVVTPMGRFPNPSADNGGYLTYEYSNSPYTGNIYDAQLSNSPSWVGAELVVRKNHWVIDRATITSQNNGLITFTDPSNQTSINNFGYFIQNDPRTLDEDNEWYYNPTTKKLRIFSSTDPNTKFIQAAIHDTLFYAWGKFYMQIKNIVFEGSNMASVMIETSAGVKFQNNEIRSGGLNGLKGHTLPNLQITNSTFRDIGNNGVDVLGDDIVFTDNLVRDIALYPGMGASDNDARIGARVSGLNLRMERNKFRKIGYAGLKFHGTSAYIARNDIDTFCITADDAGGIYASGGGADSLRVIEYNICANGLGQKHGTNQPDEDNSATGIYMDDRSANAIIRFNTCFNNSENGIYLHNSKNFLLDSNTLYNNTKYAVTLAHDDLENDDWRIRNIVMRRNVMYQKNSSQALLRFFSNQSDIASFGSFDGNHFYTVAPVFHVSSNSGSSVSTLNLTQWRSTYGWDTQTGSAAITAPSDSISVISNPLATYKVTAVDRVLRDLGGASYSSTVVIPPHGSKIFTAIRDIPFVVSVPTKVNLRRIRF